MEWPVVWLAVPTMIIMKESLSHCSIIMLHDCSCSGILALAAIYQWLLLNMFGYVFSCLSTGWAGVWHDYMWLDFPVGVLYMYSFKTHLSLIFDNYINGPTAHVCNAPKGWTIFFHSIRFLKPVWHPLVHLKGQAIQLAIQCTVDKWITLNSYRFVEKHNSNWIFQSCITKDL